MRVCSDDGMMAGGKQSCRKESCFRVTLLTANQTWTVIQACAVRSWLLNTRSNFVGYRVHENIICGYLGRLLLEQARTGEERCHPVYDAV